MRKLILLGFLGLTGCGYHPDIPVSSVYSHVGNCTVYRVDGPYQYPVFTTVCPDGRASTKTEHYESHGKTGEAVPQEVTTEINTR